jgi:MFS family permease
MSSTRVLLPAITTAGIVGYQCLISMPLMVGALVDYRGFTVGTVGIVGTLELLGMAVATICISQVIHKMDIARLGLLCAIILAGMQFMSAFNFIPQTFYLERSITGLAAGVQTGIMASIIAQSTSPERLTALAILGVAFFGGILNIIMPYIIGHTGVSGGYISLAVITLLSLPGYFFFPPRVDGSLKEQTPFRPKFLLLAGFAFIFGLASSGMWAFTERMGVAIGMHVTDVGYLLGGGTFFGLIGAGLAAVLGNKYGSAFPIIIATSTLTLSGFVIPQVFYVPYFVALFLLFRFAQNFNDPFVVGLVARHDGQGRLIALNTGFGLLGSAFGPLTAGLVVGDDQNFEKLGWLYFIFTSAAFFLFYNFIKYIKKIEKIN